MMNRYLPLLYALLVFSFPVRAHDITAHAYNLEYVANEGQWDGNFLYRAMTGNAAIYLEPKAFTFVVGAADNAVKIADFKHGKLNTPPLLDFHAYKMHFEGARRAMVSSEKALSHYYNYFLGADKSKWKSGIHPVQVVNYRQIYEGVDIRIASEEGNMKYDFIVHPNGAVSDIKLRYEGIEGVSLRNGALQIRTSVGTIIERKPYAYQLIDGVKTEVRCNYKLNGNVVSFSFPQGYNKGETLIIDPVVEFATFIGAVSDSWGNSATYDSVGNFYAGGTVDGPQFPTTTGAYQATFRGGGTGGNASFRCDITITKFTADGTALLFSTFFGGTNNEQPHSMIVDKSGNLVVAGRTYSNDFPVTAGSYDQSHNGSCDIFIAKFNPTGTTLMASTYYGGSGDDGVNVAANFLTISSIKYSYADDGRTEVIVDRQNNIYVAAPTQSNNVPLLNATQTTFAGIQDALVIKFNTNLDTLKWATYLGGNNYDAAYVLALDTSEQFVYVAGGTASSNFPMVTGGLWPTYQGGLADGFIMKFQNFGTYQRAAGTFIGRSNYDQVFGIQVDVDNDVYVTGNSLGGTFPVTAGVYSNPNSSQFIMKLNPNLNTNIYSTVFGSGTSSVIDITPVAFLVDTCHNVYISGWGGGPFALPGSNTNGMPLTLAPHPHPAFQQTTDGMDFYFIVFSKDAADLMYATYYGGNGVFEHVDGGTSRFDKNGVIYQAICGGCGGTSAVPTTPGVYSPQNRSNNCNLLAVKIAFNFGAVHASASAEPEAEGCMPLFVQFANTSTNATDYLWDFGDGSPLDTSKEPAHTFTNPGSYQVRLIASNPHGCNQLTDTFYITIKVDTSEMHAAFTYTTVDSCDPYRANFENRTTFSYKAAADQNTRFDWDFGDGSGYTGETPPLHSFPGPGSYTIRLIVTDSTACNSPDTITGIITFDTNYVKANMSIPDTICIAQEDVYFDMAVNATGVLWDFGDGTQSADRNPRHRYPDTGTYTVTYVVENPLSCNGVDTIIKKIHVNPMPNALFDHSPNSPKTNIPIEFTNKSTDAVRYEWDLGDGTHLNDEHVKHLYKRSGRYRVCLTAYSPENCQDIYCREVEADIRPLIDVPSAFSPNGDGNNDILYVRGASVASMVFKIYNRWGELVFESNDINIGWDGTYKGKEQEVEVYAYTLFATFYDGTTATKQGNITLLR